MLKLNEKYSLADIISAMKDVDSRDDDFCVYGESHGDLIAGGHYYIAAYDDDNDRHPPIVRAKKLYYLYSGEHFADVIDSVIEQKPSASLEDYVKALNYYAEYDDFLEF